MPKRLSTSYIKSILKHLKFGKKLSFKAKILFFAIALISLPLAISLFTITSKDEEEDEPIGWC